MSEADIFDALLSNTDVDPKALAASLRQKQGMGTLAAMTGIAGLQKLGPQMVEQADKGAQDYATLRDRNQNLALSRAIAIQNHNDAMENARIAETDRGERADSAAALARELHNEPAPSVKDIIDPKDNTRMISVDTRVYRPGGTLGDPGVIGVAGKEPTAAKAAEARGTGQQAVTDMIDTLRGYYKDLDKGGGITSTLNGSLPNAMRMIQESGVGQFAGRTFGTQNQSLRNQILQQRPLILQAIKSATGMSSKQMDSNAELKLWLSTVTDPTTDVQTAMSNLENLERHYGVSAAVNKAPSGAAPTTARAVAVGSGGGGERTPNNPLDRTVPMDAPSAADNEPAVEAAPLTAAQLTRLAFLRKKHGMAR